MVEHSTENAGVAGSIPALGTNSLYLDGLLAHFPYLYCVVNAARGDTFAIRRPRYSGYIAGMAVIGGDRVATEDIPDLYGFIVAGGGEAFAGGGPGEGVDGSGRVAGDEVFFAGGDVPDLRGFVGAGGGEAFAVGGPGYGVYSGEVVVVGELAASDVEEEGEEFFRFLHGIPDLHFFVFAAGGEALPVGGPGYD